MGPAPAPQTPEICEEKAQLERSYLNWSVVIKMPKLRSTVLELYSGKNLADRPGPNI